MKTALVVEDEQMTRTLISKILRRSGYKVAEASCGEEAIGIAGRLVPDVVILDMTMPNKNSFTLAEELRGIPNISGVPFLMLTYFSGELYKTHSKHCRIDEFMSKPFDIRDLAAKVEKLTKGALDQVCNIKKTSHNTARYKSFFAEKAAS